MQSGHVGRIADGRAVAGEMSSDCIDRTSMLLKICVRRHIYSRHCHDETVIDATRIWCASFCRPTLVNVASWVSSSTGEIRANLRETRVQ